jgi:excisionase family DNA binding protein
MKEPKNGVLSIQENILTTEKVAEVLGITERTVLDKLRSGEIKGYKKNKQWYCLLSDLVVYIKG